MDTIINREFRKAIHLPKNHEREDTHIVSELLTMLDGSKRVNLKIIKNYKRPFFVTKKIYRKRHKGKIEYDDMKHLERVDTTESDALKILGFKLGERGRPDMRRLKMSPYLYWADMRSTTIIKKMYNSNLNGDFTPFKICTLDIEADVLTSEISLITLAMGAEVFTYVNKHWMGDKDEDKFRRATFDVYRNDAPGVLGLTEDGVVTTETGGMKINIIFCKHEGETIKRAIAKTHVLKPDILTAWNAIYDITTIVDRARNKWKMDPKDLFSDPSIPQELRRFYIKKDDNDYKKMNSGKESFVPFHARWHIFETTSYYTILDNMASFFYIRNGSEPQVPGGYGLDNILDNYVNFKKLKPSIKGIAFMDKYTFNKTLSDSHKPAYCAYNIFDSVSLIMLDNKTKDLTINLPLLLQDSEIDIFKSGPKKLLDSYTFFLFDNGKAIGTKSPIMKKFEGLGTKNWIVTLDAWKKGFDNTLQTFEGIDTLRGNIRLQTLDLDLISAYPFQTLMFDLGSQTTSRELLNVDGFEKDFFVKENLGVCTGKTQALSFSSKMLNLPTVFEVDKFIDNNKHLIKSNKV